MIFKISNGIEYRLNDLSEDGFYIRDEKLQSYILYIPTSEEQAIANGLIAEYNEKLARDAYLAERQALLGKGLVTADGKMWFNEKYATMFIVKVSGAIACKLKSVKWKNANREVIEVSVNDAKVYIKEIIEALDTVYLGE